MQSMHDVTEGQVLQLMLNGAHGHACAVLAHTVRQPQLLAVVPLLHLLTAQC